MNANEIIKAMRIVMSIERDLKDGFTIEEIAEDNNMTVEEINDIRATYWTLLNEK